MMNTLKMIAEIKSTCRNLETEKRELVARVKEIDDRLTAYRMAIDSLELTMPKEEEPKATAPAPAPAPVAEKPKRKRRSANIEYNGERKSIVELAKAHGINENTLRSRLYLGWSIADALSKDVDKRKHPKGQKVFVYDPHGNPIRQYATVGAASKELNLPETTIRSIIHNMTKEEQLKSRNYYLAYAS